VTGERIYFEGRLAATVTPIGIAFSAWAGELPRDDPVWRIVAAAAACAFDVLTGCLAGPFTEDLAVVYARGAAIGAAAFEPAGITPPFPPATVRDH
jgi:hypothetical protein